MMENEALQVIQKMNVKINGTEDEVKKVYGALEVAKRALKKGKIGRASCRERVSSPV